MASNARWSHRHDSEYWSLWKDMSGYFTQFGFMQTSTYEGFVSDVIAPYVSGPVAPHSASRPPTLADIDRPTPFARCRPLPAAPAVLKAPAAEDDDAFGHVEEYDDRA